MSNDKIKEEIKAETERLRLYALASIAIGGGTISIIRSYSYTFIDALLIIAGALIILAFTFRMKELDNRIKELTDELKHF
jgi:hypothetical protein